MEKSMRLLTFVTLSVSSLALSGCSFLGGNSSHGNAQKSSSYTSQSSSNDSCCGATLSRWNAEGGIGADFLIGGEAFKADEARGVTAGQELKEVSMSDAYEVGMRAELGGSFALNPSRKITGQVTYSQAEGKVMDLGTQNGNALSGEFTNYQSLGLEAGIRQYFRPRIAGKRLNYRPYVEGKLGAQKIDDIDLMYIEEGQAAVSTTEFYDGGWVPTVAATVGVETPMFKRGTLGIETGIRYSGALDSSESLNTQAPQFSGTNNGSEVWTVPLTIRGRYRF